MIKCSYTLRTIIAGVHEINMGALISYIIYLDRKLTSGSWSQPKNEAIARGGINDAKWRLWKKPKLTRVSFNIFFWIGLWVQIFFWIQAWFTGYTTVIFSPIDFRSFDLYYGRENVMSVFPKHQISDVIVLNFERRQFLEYWSHVPWTTEYKLSNGTWHHGGFSVYPS